MTPRFHNQLSSKPGLRFAPSGLLYGGMSVEGLQVGLSLRANSLHEVRALRPSSAIRPTRRPDGQPPRAETFPPYNAALCDGTVEHQPNPEAKNL